MDRFALLGVIVDRLVVRRLSAALLVAAAIAIPSILVSSARAAETVFPQTSRVGLTPPAGMQLSKSFPGFEDQARHAGIIIAELPPQAFADIEKNFTADALKAQGV